MSSLEFDAPLLKTMFRRRTRRFPVGGELRAKRAGLAYSSEEEPYPLSELETAFLCFAAIGTTGVTVEEIRHLMGHLTVVGRTAGSPCASLTMHLFFTDDHGTFFYRNPDLGDVLPEKRVRIASATDRRLILEDYQNNLVKLQEGRLDISRDAIGSAFESMVNLPGTTLFIPIADTTREYINLLLTGIAQFRWQMWDEIEDQPAGVRRWIENGFLDGPKLTIFQYDGMLPWVCNLEAGMAMQNLMLAATAVGLGSFAMHTIDLPTVMRCLGMRFEAADRELFPQAVPNPVGIDELLEGFCPPYRTIEEAVDEIAALKWGEEGIYGVRGYDLPRGHVYDDIVEIAKGYCAYVYKKYGRFPKYCDAMFIPVLLQVHHLDIGFYDKFFPEYLSAADRDHRSIWH